MIEQSPALFSHRPAVDAIDGHPPPDVEWVLVVEKDHDDSQALVRIIEDRDRHALVTSSTGDTLDALERAPIDVVVLGLSQRDASGFALLSAIRDRPEFDGVPLLVMPAQGEPASISRAIDLGANAVLPKPLNPTLVRMLLDSAAEQSRWRHGPPAKR